MDKSWEGKTLVLLCRLCYPLEITVGMNGQHYDHEISLLCGSGLSGHAAHIKEEVNFYRNEIEGWLVNRRVSGFILLVSSVLIWLTKEAKFN